MLIGLCIAALVVVMVLVWAAGGGRLEIGEKKTEAVEVSGVTVAPKTESSTLTVVSWNVAWGFGWGSEFSKGAPEKTAEMLNGALEKMGRLLASVDADIVLLQEVDFVSDRSFNVDQGEILARASGLPYLARAVSWDLNYLPFPYWPPSKHAGRIRSGGAILSRFPLSDCSVDLLEKPDDLPFWYSPFYLFRYAQYCSAQWGENKLLVANTHLDAFDAPNRALQTKHLAAKLQESMTPFMIFGGDLNSPPPESPQRKGYADEPETDHTTDDVVATFRAITGLSPAVPPAAYAADPAAYFTFPAHSPNRTLDHIFHGSGFRVIEARVLREAGDPSDHLPILVRLARNR